jgi:hypothetical protein
MPEGVPEHLFNFSIRGFHWQTMAPVCLYDTGCCNVTIVQRQGGHLLGLAGSKLEEGRSLVQVIESAFYIHLFRTNRI